LKVEKNSKVLCLVAGGSGGHITPALVLGAEWIKATPHGRILMFSSKKKIDNLILAEDKTITNIASLTQLSLQPLPGKKLWRYPLFCMQLVAAFCKSLFVFYRTRPCKIISSGGLIALPVCLAGRLVGIEIELHELNIIPGKATRLLAPLAHKIYLTFETSRSFFVSARHDYRSKCITKAYPIRFSAKDKQGNREQIIQRINKNNLTLPFAPSKKTLFLLGGSQGSLFLNNQLKTMLEKQRVLFANIQIIHQTGMIDKTDWEVLYKKHAIPVITFSYTHSIKDFYILADLVLCRAGAGTLFELAFFGKQSLIVPLKNLAANHQEANAREMSARYPELFTVCDQDELAVNSDLFAQRLRRLASPSEVIKEVITEGIGEVVGEVIKEVIREAS